MEIEWWSFDFKTGQRAMRLPVRSAGKLQRIIGAQTTSTVRVRCSVDGVPIPGWNEATTPGRSFLVAIDKNGDRPIWGGLVLRRTSTRSAEVDVSVVSAESYLFRRYISSTVQWGDADPAQVAVDVLALITDLPPLAVRAVMTGNAIVNGYFEFADNKRIGDVLVDLSGLAGGIEWTVDVEWADADHEYLRYVVQIAPRLGTGGDPDGTPAGPSSGPPGWTPSQWLMPGAVTDFELIEDFSENVGANDVIALSSGEGDSKPRSTRYEDTALLAAFARFERRFTPATSITQVQTLDQYAEAELTAKRLGLTQLNLSATLSASPALNGEWWLGDDIDVSLTCDRFPHVIGSDGFKEAGLTRRLRAIGWDLDLDANTVTPRILEEL